MISGIFFAPLGVGGRLRGFVEQLEAHGIAVSIVQDIVGMMDLVETDPTAVHCVAVDLSHGTDRAAAAATLDQVHEAVPGAPIIAITDGADGGLVIACLRAGAADVIDLRFDRPEVAPGVVDRACQRQLEHLGELETIAAHRGVLDEMLKDLIQTERRTLDLEFDLAKLGKPRPDLPPPPEQRAPAVLVIDSDRAQVAQVVGALERLGVTVVSYPTAAEAVREVSTLLRWGTTFDLGVVSGTDAMDTVRKVRGLLPGIASVLLTSGASEADDHAANAIVWTTPTPITNVPAVTKRLAQLAGEALVKTREQAYLDNIKARHERVLARYRALRRP